MPAALANVDTLPMEEPPEMQQQPRNRAAMSSRSERQTNAMSKSTKTPRKKKPMTTNSGLSIFEERYARKQQLNLFRMSMAGYGLNDITERLPLVQTFTSIFCENLLISPRSRRER